ncbi:zinc transporter 2-like isoform X1 [Amphibalanus amphitrite]|uniref:zinc transporter 2-like isoform X1 n=1 Tax=Amphibalanus amphitrite TaxID=1232801 RepID=UPI001C91C19B|nr:zinc transporter 2-like isoform X1 [Amphibalanus amphitrite]
MAEAPSPPAEVPAVPSRSRLVSSASSTYCVSFKDTHLDVVVKTPVLPPRDDNPKLGFSGSQDGAVVGEDSRKYGQKVRLLDEEPDAILPAEGPDGGGSNTFGPTADTPVDSRRIIYCLHGDELTACEQGCSQEKIEELQRLYKDSHCHVSRAAGMNQAARRKLMIASALCLLFMVAEIIGGYLSNSIAIATDAAHLLADFASFMISLFSLWVASRPATARMSFGWHRAEVMGALISVLLIWVVTGVLVYMAIQRVIYQQFELDAVVMLITSGLGVLVNIVMGCTLHQHGHSHGGGSSHSHGGGSAHSHGAQNINVRAAFIHVLGDFLQSIGVFIAALVIYFKPMWILVDPICTFVFSIFVLATTLTILKDTLNVLMEGIPKGIDIEQLQAILEGIPGVLKVHNLRVWSLSMDKPALSAHIVIGPDVKPQGVLRQATLLVRERHDFYEMTLQIEEYHDQMQDCDQCQDTVGARRPVETV